MRRIVMAAAFWLLPVSVCAQWLNFRTPGIPRTANGKPDLAAAVPRTADGKPDLSGLWQPTPNFYWVDVIQDVKEEEIFRPAAEALFRKRIAEFARDSPHFHCLPEGPSQIFGSGGAEHSLYRIIQSPNVVGLLYEGGGYRQIFLDGRGLPKDPNPTWNGYSVGHWDNDTLVVETAGFNDTSWLDLAGHPHSEDLRVTERFRRVDFGHMQFQITFEDPSVLTRPLSASLPVTYAADTDMLEYVCNEGERDAVHLVGSARDGVTISPAILARYAGTYTAGPLTVIVSLVDGQLYLNGFPLVARSETKFDYLVGTLEFFRDATGTVTHFVAGGIGGDGRVDRKR